MKISIPLIRKFIFMILPVFAAASLFAQSTLTSNGSSGALTVSGSQIINNYYPVTNISGNQIRTSRGFSPAVGDKVLIIAMAGPDAGTWQWDSVVAAGNPFQVSGIYRSFDSTGDVIQVITVPQYTSLHITSTGKLTAIPYSDSTGGILTFMVLDTLKIESGGICDVNALGYQPLSGASGHGVGGAGGAGGPGGSYSSGNVNGGDSLLIADGSPGLGATYGSYGGTGTHQSFPQCPGCGEGLINNDFYGEATNLSSVGASVSIRNSTIFMGGAGAGGQGGMGGYGGGGGGASNIDTGSAGGSGGSGGAGGRGGAGGGIILFSASYLVIPSHDTVFLAQGDTGTSGASGANGGNGGAGANGTNCSFGGGGGGAQGGNGGEGGEGGGGGIIYAVVTNPCINFDSTSYASNGGLGGNGGNGGNGGQAGSDGSTTGQPCSNGGHLTSPPNGGNGTGGSAGAPGNDGGAGSAGGSSGGGGGLYVLTCDTNPPIGNFFQSTYYGDCGGAGFLDPSGLSATGGNGVYTFSVGAPGASFCGPSGPITPYTVTVTDSSGCSSNFLAYVQQYDDQYTFTTISQTNASCPNSSDATCTLVVTDLSYPGGECNPSFSINFTGQNWETYPYTGPDTLTFTGLTAGNYYVGLNGRFQCSTPYAASVIINADNTPSYGGEYDTICYGTGFYWNDSTYTQSGIYYVPVPGGTVNGGCDSFSTLNLYIQPLIIGGGEYDTVCTLAYGYYWNNNSYYQPGIYIDTLAGASVNGCDSLATLNLFLTAPLRGSGEYDTVCTLLYGYYWNNNYYYQPGQYIDTLYAGSINGCDTIAILNLTLLSPLSGGEYDTACANTPFFWSTSGNIYFQAGVYYDTIYGGSINGCDTVAILNLTFFDPITVPNPTPQTTGDNCGYTFDNFWNGTYGGDGNYTYNDVPGYSYCLYNEGNDLPYTVYVTDGHGCTGQYNTDVINIDDQFDLGTTNITNASCQLSGDGSYTGYIIDNTNQECNYTWNLIIQGTSTSFYYTSSGSQAGTVISLTGLSADTYLYTISGSDACSPVTNGSFTVYATDNPSNGYETDTICSGASFSWNGSSYSQSGNYSYTIYGGAAYGCDSIDNLTLVVLDPITASNTGPQYVGDLCGGTFNNSLATISGGDGNYSFNDIPGTPYCNGTGQDVPYTVYITDGHSCTGQYNADLINVDDAFILNGAISNATCPNSSDGSFVAVVTDIGGGFANQCNGSAWNLNINGPVSNSYGSFGNPNDTVYMTGLPPGTYTYTINGSNQCSPVNTSSFTISSTYPTAVSNQYDTVCYGDSAVWNGTTYDQPGNYSNTIPGGSITGCDSISNFTLIWRSHLGSFVYDTIDAGGILNLNGNAYSHAGTYWDTLSSAAGCDSIVILFLTVDTLPSYTVLYDSICAGTADTLDNQLLYHSGTYTDTLSGYIGQDSIVTLHLFLYPSPVISLYDTITAGGSIQAGGQTYTQGGIYADTLTSIFGCDSIVNIYLTVDTPVLASSLYDTVCAGTTVSFGSQVITQSGTYTDTLTDQIGGDSIVTLHLHVNPVSAITLHDSICSGSSVSAGGHSYSQSGTYTDTLTGVHGCDSIITLDLVVYPIASANLYDSICQGGSVSVGGHTYTQSGTFTDTLAGAHGCDSIVTLDLVVYPIASANLYDTLIAGDTLHIGGRSYYQSGSYTDSLTGIHGCDSIVHLYLYVGTSATYAQLYDTICQGFSLSLGGHSYTLSGTYTDTLTSHLGGDSIVTLHLSVTSAILTSATDTICQGSSVIVGTNTYTTSGSYLDTLTTAHGCDSIHALQLTVLPLVTPTVSITLSRGPVSAGMQTDTFAASYTDCPGATFAWYENGSALGINTQVAVITIPQGATDSISCRVECSNECQTASYAISNNLYTGIDQISFIQGVNIYPNPTQGAFTMDINATSTSNKNATISVTDLLGRTVISLPVTLRSGFNREEVSLGDAVSGVYTVQLNVDGASLYYRIVLDK